MRLIHDVQGTQEIVPSVEIGVTTVYVREDIERRTDSEGNPYWNYTEYQYTLPEYIEIISNQNTTDKENIDNAIAELSIVIGGLMNVQ